MRIYPVLLLFIAVFLQASIAQGQGMLSGVVQDSVTGRPLAFASVFLANTTLGVTTTEQGTFIFSNVPAGTYDVVGSYVGYRLAKQTVTIGSTPQQLTLRLGPSANRLGEVVVRPNPNSADEYQKFVELFLGRSTFSRQCRIRNPDDIVVDFDSEKRELRASAAKFVQVDNQALGYRIKYYGLQFFCDFNKHIVTFYGEPIFEEMTSRNNGQQKRWAENREKAYRGSLTHFLKSVRDDQVTANGFLAQRLRVVPNPRYARIDSMRKQLVRERSFGEISKAGIDSLNRWRTEPQQFSMLYTAPRPIDSLRRMSADGNQIFLRFRDYLQVTYIRAAPDPLYLRSLPLQATTKTISTTQVSQLLLRTPEMEIQANGHLVNPLAVFTDEYWGFEKMGEFLPQNYLPPAAVPAP